MDLLYHCRNNILGGHHLQGAGLRFCVCYRVLCCCLFVLFVTGCCVLSFYMFVFATGFCVVVFLRFCLCYRVLCCCLFVFVTGCQGAGGVSLERQHTTHFTGWSPVGGSTPPSNHLFGTSAIFSIDAIPFPKTNPSVIH